MEMCGVVLSLQTPNPRTPHPPQHQSKLPTTVCEKLCRYPDISPHPPLRRWGTAGRLLPLRLRGLGVVPTVRSRPLACLWGGHGGPCCCIAPPSPRRCTAQGSADSVGSCSPRCLQGGGRQGEHGRRRAPPGEQLGRAGWQGQAVPRKGQLCPAPAVGLSQN